MGKKMLIVADNFFHVLNQVNWQRVLERQNFSHSQKKNIFAFEDFEDCNF